MRKKVKAGLQSVQHRGDYMAMCPTSGVTGVPVELTHGGFMLPLLIELYSACCRAARMQPSAPIPGTLPSDSGNQHRT
jgi:hypothetical protein